MPVELGMAGDPEAVLKFARAAEDLGFDEISAVEHAVVIANTDSRYPYSASGKSHLPDDCPLPDPLELLSFVAGATTRLGLATGVLVAPNHNPVVLAKRLATLDRLSQGRTRICLGVGWMREEIEACGGDFGRRGRATDEAIAVMRALWAGGSEGVDFAGEFHSFTGAYSFPKPYRDDRVPLYIGGHSAAAARRAGRFGDGFQPLGLAGEELAETVDTMRVAATEAGRDPSEVALVLGHVLPRMDESKIEWAHSLGSEHILLSASRHAADLDDVIDEMAACAERLSLV